MTTADPTTPLFEDDQPGDSLAFYVKMIEEEATALFAVLPQAMSRQWEASPVPRPRDDTHQRSLGDVHSDPTADVALDPRRMAVRTAVFNSRQVLYNSAVAVRAARMAMERSVKWYDGEQA